MIESAIPRWHPIVMVRHPEPRPASVLTLAQRSPIEVPGSILSAIVTLVLGEFVRRIVLSISDRSREISLKVIT